ncbi:MAG: hypothetical protein FD163_863 [Hyphomonadaceae bacterium]|nr:MAG: hypothetical protein FD163_863 [Hyphomonadaceae bacterium]
MDFSSFKKLFAKAIEEALEPACEILKIESPPHKEFELHFNSLENQKLNFESVASHLYHSHQFFHKIIDIMVVAISKKTVTIFVRPSGHGLVTFENTWGPESLGPFKIIKAE